MWFKTQYAHGQCLWKKRLNAHLWSRYNSQSSDKSYNLGNTTNIQISVWIGDFLNPYWVQRENSCVLTKSPLVCSSNANWRCVALPTRAMVREKPPASDYPCISFHEPAKKGLQKTERLSSCNKQESGQSTALWLAKWAFPQYSNHGWESSAALSFPGLAPKT